MNGVEFFNHPYELGIRKAKELMFLSEWLSAEEARAVGMVNRVVARIDLDKTVLDLAEKIALKPLFALKITKEALNIAQDNMGRRATMSAVFSMHQLLHAHNMLVHGFLIDVSHLAPAVRARVEMFRQRYTRGDLTDVTKESVEAQRQASK
jgi:enoyl-CoA hydratase